MRLIEGGGESTPRKEVRLEMKKGGKGMINLTNMVYRDENFQSMFVKLCQASLDYHAAIKLRKFRSAFKSNAKVIAEGIDAIQKDHVKDGKWIEETRAEAEAKMKALYEQPLYIDTPPFFATELKGLDLTIDEWEALEPMIADPTNLTPAS